MAPRVMHALVYNGYIDGAVGLKHVEVAVPRPIIDEILIKVEATTLNPVDWKAYKIRTWLHPFLSTASHPPIPCNDVGGEVVEVGSGVQKFKPGDKVISVMNIFTAGGLSEYCVAKEKVTVLRPAEVSAAEGAGLPVAGLSAHVALTRYGGLKLENNHEHEYKHEPQKNILITAASGGVGHYTVQLAKLGNAHVTATCGARNIELVKGLGADEVLDYKTVEGASLKSPSGRKYDVVIHCASPVSWSVFASNLSENGVVVDLTHPGARAMWTNVVNKITRSNKKLVTFTLNPQDDIGLKFLVGLVKEGKLKTVVDSKHALSRGEDAWSRGISGHATGKIIIEP